MPKPPQPHPPNRPPPFPPTPTPPVDPKAKVALQIEFEAKDRAIFLRLVTAFERIAVAHERIAAALEPQPDKKATSVRIVTEPEPLGS